MMGPESRPIIRRAMQGPTHSAPRHVVFVASECEPWAKTGGLADVVDALARALGHGEIAVDVFLPAYRTARRPPINERITVAVPVSRSAEESSGNDAEVGTVDILSGPANGYRLRLVDHPFHFDRAGFYGEEGGDYADNGARFALFCRAALEALRVEGRPVDVLHGHDWQAALALLYRDVHYANDPLIGTAATVLTIHNLAYHGWVARERFPELQLPEEVGELAGVDLLREGIRAADLVTTVSPTYAREALTPEYGMGLEDDLAARNGRFIGIMNGIDPGLWDPATDASLPVRYGRRADRARGVAPLAEGKRAAKADLATRHGLSEADMRPLLGMIGRLDPQKGFDLVAGAAEGMVRAGANLIVLGTGRAELLAGLRGVAADNPGRIAVIERFDRDEARRIYAGSDLFLMPSRFEPSGQGQLIAFRYGTPVIARRTGGLADTVIDDDDAPRGKAVETGLGDGQGSGPGSGPSNGFLFDDPTPAALLQAVRRALFAYADRARWQALCRQVMALDHSWDRPAREYVAAYGTAIGFRRVASRPPPRRARASRAP
jgi:starch synthase